MNFTSILYFNFIISGGEAAAALYTKFIKSYLRAHNDQNYEEAHKKAQALWKDLILLVAGDLSLHIIYIFK